MEQKLLNSIRRQYYLSEALAIYDAYYRPLVRTYPPAVHLEQSDCRSDDRPLATVPLVFHCTTQDKFRDIVETGSINPGKNNSVSFTEIPIGELDRMRIRFSDEELQVAIAFPRRYIENLAVAPVLYLKHHPSLQEKLRQIIKQEPSIEPFIELSDDVSAFQELRTMEKVDIQNAVWLLTTTRDKDKTLKLNGLEEYRNKYGGIPISYWHRTHQIGILGEMRYLTIHNNKSGKLEKFECKGEFYADRDPFSFSVTLPEGRTHEINLRSVQKSKSSINTEGPMYDIDIAYLILSIIKSNALNVDNELRYRQIEHFPNEFGQNRDVD
jgi:hypothetical protein